MSGQETARAQEATGELNIWTHLSNSESGPTCEPSLRGQKFRSVALSGDRIAAITDANNGSISWFPKYRGWSSASSLPQKEGKESFENKTETEGKAGNNIEEPQQDTPRNEQQLVEEALNTQLGRGRPSDIALGKDHVLVTSDDGRVFAWGRGEEGQLGLPHALGTDMPAEVKALSKRGVVLVSAGRAHSAAITHDGGLYMWGSNSYGQTGLGKGMPWSSVLAPRFVHAFLGVPVAMVSCGHNFTACVTNVGEIWTWGEGGSGQLGIGKILTKCNTPQLACGIELTEDNLGFSSVTCGWGHCMAVSQTTGQLYTWGLNSHGQLGLGDIQKRTVPTLVTVNQLNNKTGMEEKVLFEDCSAGDNNSIALTRDVRCLWAWGSTNRCHGMSKNDGHVLTPKHVSSTGVSGYGVGLIACGNQTTAAFSPTSVRQIQPSAGPTDGGSDISIICDGVWHSDKILVRFSAILTGEDEDEEECVEIEAGIYDEESGSIKCRTPPWPLDEQVLVEVTVNGYDFTTDNMTYTFYNPPTVHGAWPPTGFIDVPTTVTVYGTSLVDSDDLSVRFRPLISNEEGKNGENEEGGLSGTSISDMIVPARFLSKGQVSCTSPIFDNINGGIIECAVDVAINGKDFTDAGVVFTFHGFTIDDCMPLCGPRNGGSEVSLVLSDDTKPSSIDSDGLRIKIDFGGQRMIEVPCKVKGNLLKFKTSKMDGTAKNSKFPKYEFTPPPQDESTTSKKKTESSVATTSSIVEEQVEPEAWPKDVGSLPGTIFLSVNGGETYKELNFNFIAYKSSMSSLELSNNIVMSTGNAEIEIGLKGTFNSEETKENNTEENNTEEDNTEEEKTEEEKTEAGDGDAVENESDGFGMEMKEIVPEPTPIFNWLFPSTEIKIKFKGSGDDDITSIDEITNGTYDEETGSITCAIPTMQCAIEWSEWFKTEKTRALEEGSTEEPLADEEDEDGEAAVEKIATPQRPSICDVDVFLAMDGISFEKISTITMMPPPTISEIVTDEGGALPSSSVRIIGDGFGSAGSIVRVDISHIASGNDYTIEGTIEDGVGDDSESTCSQSVLFNAPIDIVLEEGKDSSDYQCIAEICIDKQTLTDWGMTFTMAPQPAE